MVTNQYYNLKIEINITINIKFLQKLYFPVNQGIYLNLKFLIKVNITFVI